MAKKHVSRRDFLRMASGLAAGALATACQPKTVIVKEEVLVTQIVKETIKETVVVEGTPKVVEKEVTKVVEKVVEKVITATPLPVVEEEAEDVMGFPRSETAFIAQLSGRVGSPDNFNEWVGWKWRDRGMANLMNEALCTIEYVRGAALDGSAAGPPEYTEDFT